MTGNGADRVARPYDVKQGVVRNGTASPTNEKEASAPCGALAFYI